MLRELCEVVSHHLSCRMAYIEESLKLQSLPEDESDESDAAPFVLQEALYHIADRKAEKQKPTADIA